MDETQEDSIDKQFESLSYPHDCLQFAQTYSNEHSKNILVPFTDRNAIRKMTTTPFTNLGIRLTEYIILPNLASILATDTTNTSDFWTGPYVSAKSSYLIRKKIDSIDDEELRNFLSLCGESTEMVRTKVSIAHKNYTFFTVSSILPIHDLLETYTTPLCDSTDILPMVQNISDIAFANPSSCAGLLKHRQFAVTFWTVFWLGMHKISKG